VTHPLTHALVQLPLVRENDKGALVARSARVQLVEWLTARALRKGMYLWWAARSAACVLEMIRPTRQERLFFDETSSSLETLDGKLQSATR
jgi:hypothetical protein